LAVISIIDDRFELETINGNTLVVQDISDYVDGCFKIIEAIHNNLSLNVVVREATCFIWFSRLKGQYDEYVELRESTPKQVLMNKWHLKEFPYDVSDTEVLEANLLKLPIVPQSGEIFGDIILEYFYSKFLTYPEFPIGRIVELLNDLLNCKWQENQEIPLVFKQYQKRLNEWKDMAPKREMKALVELFKQEPAIFEKELINYKLIENYPSGMGERVLGENYQIFRMLPIYLKDLVVKSANIKKARDEIELYLTNEVDIKKAEDVENLLNTVSGQLVIEFNKIKEALLNLKDDITIDLIERTKRKFSSISEQISLEIQKLDLLISPPKPNTPKNTWDENKWIQWAVDEYLPYHFWLEESNTVEAEVASFAKSFGDWYYDNFLRLRTSFDQMLHKLFPNLCHDIRESENIALVLSIDNCNFKYIDAVKNAFKKREFFCEYSSGYFAMIPTETDVCKKSLFSGELERKSLGNKSYEEIIEDGWKSFVEGKKFKYLSKIGKLNDITTIEHDIYFLNFCGIDEILHKDSDELGKSHKEEVSHNLETLVNTVISFAKRLGIEHKLLIYLCTDHGSTKIQGGTENVIDRKYYDSKSEDKHHRFVTVSDAQIENLPSHVENNCYVLHKDEYGLLENVLIAKGYGRFKKTSENFYVHGGLTPEEVIVPFAVFRMMEVEPRNILVHLEQNIFRYKAKSKIKVTISNINEYDIDDVEVMIKNSNVETESLYINKIKPKKQVLKEITAIFKKTYDSKENNYLLMRIGYKFMGKDYSQDVDIPIEIKSMVERQTNLDDL
jgi:hypothetical protein